MKFSSPLGTTEPSSSSLAASSSYLLKETCEVLSGLSSDTLPSVLRTGPSGSLSFMLLMPTPRSLLPQQDACHIRLWEFEKLKTEQPNSHGIYCGSDTFGPLFTSLFFQAEGNNVEHISDDVSQPPPMANAVFRLTDESCQIQLDKAQRNKRENADLWTDYRWLCIPLSFHRALTIRHSGGNFGEYEGEENKILSLKSLTVKGWLQPTTCLYHSLLLLLIKWSSHIQMHSHLRDFEWKSLKRPYIYWNRNICRWVKRKKGQEIHTLAFSVGKTGFPRRPTSWKLPWAEFFRVCLEETRWQWEQGSQSLMEMVSWSPVSIPTSRWTGDMEKLKTPFPPLLWKAGPPIQAQSGKPPSSASSVSWWSPSNVNCSSLSKDSVSVTGS